MSVACDLHDGEAKAGRDYAMPTSLVTLLPNEIEHDVVIPIIDNKIFDGDRTFTVALRPHLLFGVGASDHAQVVIVDDDAPTVSVHDVAVAEGNGYSRPVTVTVQHRNVPHHLAESVPYSTVPGTAIAGKDYGARHRHPGFRPRRNAEDRYDQHPRQHHA